MSLHHIIHYPLYTFPMLFSFYFNDFFSNFGRGWIFDRGRAVADLHENQDRSLQINRYRLRQDRLSSSFVLVHADSSTRRLLSSSELVHNTTTWFETKNYRRSHKTHEVKNTTHTPLASGAEFRSPQSPVAGWVSRMRVWKSYEHIIHVHEEAKLVHSPFLSRSSYHSTFNGKHA